MSVSLIMATVGRVQEIPRLIDSLKAQTETDFELIVVDQNPDDRLLEVVDSARRGGLQVRHERLGPPNLSAARNHGIQVAQHEIVAFPDDDCWYEPDVIARVGAFMASHEEYAGAVVRWYEQDPAGKPEQDVEYEQLRRFRSVEAASISLFLRKQAVASSGGFDGRFGVARYFGAAEETDLILRIAADGRRIRYLPAVLVHHARGSPLAGTLREACRRTRFRERGTGGIYAKHRLPASVIARGLAAPILKALLRPQGGPRALLNGAYASLGRLEGWMSWGRRSAE